MQQVRHAMQILRAKQRHARPARAPAQLPPHPQLRGHRLERRLEPFQIESFALRRARRSAIQRELNPHEEQPQLMVLVLVRMNNVRAPLIQQS